MPNTIAEWETLYLKWANIYRADRSTLNDAILSAVADALDAAVQAKDFTDTVQYHYDHYLHLTKDRRDDR